MEDKGETYKWTKAREKDLPKFNLRIPVKFDGTDYTGIFTSTHNLYIVELRFNYDFRTHEVGWLKPVQSLKEDKLENLKNLLAEEKAARVMSEQSLMETNRKLGEKFQEAIKWCDEKMNELHGKWDFALCDIVAEMKTFLANLQSKV